MTATLDRDLVLRPLTNLLCAFYHIGIDVAKHERLRVRSSLEAEEHCQTTRLSQRTHGTIHAVVSPGQIIGRYRLVGELGRGGMGVVFEAEHVELGCRVAIKLLDASGDAHSARAGRFLREARAAAQTQHLHVVTVIDIGVYNQYWFIVMELLKGETLATLIAREGPLSANRTAELLIPIMAAVSAAHDVGVVHRDLKPANIVLANRGGHIVHPVVTDFGVSKISTQLSPEEMTSSHALLGTLHYMAPELTRAADQATPLSDEYSLDVMLYECATGRRPFQGTSPYELMHDIVTEKFARPRAVNQRVDARLEEIILRAMASDPNQRYPTVRALGAAILAVASAKTWAIWGSELLGSEALPTTLSDSLRHDDVARPVFASKTKVWQSQRVRTMLVSGVMAGTAAFGFQWDTLRRVVSHRLHASIAVVNPLHSSNALLATESAVTQSPSAGPRPQMAARDELLSGAPEGSVKPKNPSPAIKPFARTRTSARNATAAKRQARTDPEPFTTTRESRLEFSENQPRERPLEYGSNDAPILE